MDHSFEAHMHSTNCFDFQHIKQYWPAGRFWVQRLPYHSLESVVFAYPSLQTPLTIVTSNGNTCLIPAREKLSPHRAVPF